MNMKKLIMSIIAAYVVMSILGMGMDMFLAEKMLSMKAIMRMGPDLKEHAMWMYLGYFILTVLFCYIYAQHHEGKGWMEGARYGLLIGLLMSGMSMVMYAILPLDAMESLISAVGGIVIYIIGGIVTSVVYQKA